MAKPRTNGHAGPKGAAPSAHAAARPVAGRGPEIDWVRLAAGAVLGLLAAVLVGVLPVYDPWAVRAVACGLVLGLSVRGTADLVPAAAMAAVTGALATLVVGIAQTGSEAGAPSASAIMLVAVVCAVTAAVVGLVCASGRVRLAAAVALLVVVGLQLYQTGAVPGVPRDATEQLRQRIAAEPVAERYAFDGDLFIKVDHLMAKGVPYYAAFLQAFDEDQRLQGPPSGLFNIRQRWLFELWNVLPGPPGLRVLYWFYVFMAGTMVAGYATARRFVEPAAALVAPIALGGYLMMPAVTIWLPLSEFWAGMVGVFFLHAMVTERWTWAGVLAVVAFAFRELMLFLLPVYVIWWLASRRRREGTVGLAIAAVGPAVLLALHAMW